MIKYILPKKVVFDNYEDRIEFDEMIAENNINRCRDVGVILLHINIILILVDLFLYKPMSDEIVSYKYLYYSHIIVIILISLWLIAFKIITTNKKKFNKRLMNHILINIIIYWCVFMGLNSIYISGHILAYIISIFGISLVFYLSPIESFVTYLISFVVFVSGMIFIVSDVKQLYSNIINSAFVILASFFGSNLIYTSYAKEFVNNKIILKSKIELEKSNIKLKEYEKLRTDFFANISHELRTPLNMIYCSYQMMDLTLKSDNFQKNSMNKYLKVMKQNTFRLIRLINNLIDITKIDDSMFEIKLINCDIVQLVEDITNSASEFIKNKGIELYFDTQIEERIIACDPDKIERIILNLLSNAVKFTPEGGKIFVSIYLKDNNINISVKDTGIGIDDSMKELIFDRFIQVDKSISRNREGSGIGLSLVKSLVKMHNGLITLNSVIGQGSEFIVSLPDIKIKDKNEQDYVTDFMNQRVEKISIEFSDIYE
ncbi:His Kinase A (phospho-acceptor) domain-containing protein [Caloramator quimbayensis]|uniref:histidine kinase n=1 Tax=Caloramator quimbayensis TaxID=1147123 RepID=A0A1T4YAJ9_9CLOT|nr:HAMP domain-containing sensor histidine kinase [Caloramator quimbayensis]SKA98341.1 His Kinase A (phospho-acceptor) domain-containing protein [Caloramator quimbayensis]